MKRAMSINFDNQRKDFLHGEFHPDKPGQVVTRKKSKNKHMKRKSEELDVGFIGGQDPMTNEEERAISEFIKTKKLLRVKKQIRSRKPNQQSKSVI